MRRSDRNHAAAKEKDAATTQEAKFANWQRRKRAYLANLGAKPDASLLVSACDKLHNARAILSDLQGDAGEAVFDRFTARREGTLQYYETLARTFLKRATDGKPRFHELAREFHRTVGTMHTLAGVTSRDTLG